MKLGTWVVAAAVVVVLVGVGIDVYLVRQDGVPRLVSAGAIPAGSHPPAGSPSYTPAASGAVRPSQATAHSSHATTSPAAIPLRVVTVCTDPGIPGNCTGANARSFMKAQPAGIGTTMDGAQYVDDITWSGWGDAAATGTGTMEVNNCIPGCVQGTYTGYPATVTVSGLSPYGSNVEAYSEMVVSSPTSSVPPETFSSGLVP